MSEMIERVRAAILGAVGDKVLLDEGGETLIDGYVDATAIARAAIEAMREPTEAMTAEGASCIDFHDLVSDEREIDEIASSWRAMIDTALA